MHRLQVYMLCCCTFLYISCKQPARIPDSTYEYLQADYEQVKIIPTKDSIHFPLTEDTYSKVSAFNIFKANNREYISFYDHRSGFLNIYDLQSNKQTNRISLKKFFTKSLSYNLSPYMVNFDSIFVISEKALYLIDSAGKKVNKFNYRSSPAYAIPKFDNISPPILRNNHFYAAVGPYADGSSLKAVKNWRLVYDFDLLKNETKLLYTYPERYTSHLYGPLFLKQSHCVNEKGNFVFSFPADTCIYETDLNELHKAYYAKSRYQTVDIQPVAAESLKRASLIQRDYMTRNFYSSIFYDPYTQRYLRIAYSALTEADYDAKKLARKITIIIFDKDFRIIGESEMPIEVSFKTLFIAPGGNIYARTDVGDEYALDFIRLAYVENSNNGKIAHVK